MRNHELVISCFLEVMNQLTLPGFGLTKGHIKRRPVLLKHEQPTITAIFHLFKPIIERMALFA